MKHEIHTEIEIDAPAARVWSILVDFASYPQWNPFIRSISGRAEPGARLEVRIEPRGTKPMTFRPTVMSALPERELCWLGRVLAAGLFDGEHYFRIEALEAGRVHFTQYEKFSGILVPFLRRSLERGTRAGFEAMNAALKRRAEARG